MPFAFHKDPDQKIDQQYRNTIESLIPFISRIKPVAGCAVLEIGCGEGGNLKAFIENNCQVYGIDLSENKIAAARKLLASQLRMGQAQLLLEDIHRLTNEADLLGKFDIIILKDVIEHVPDKSKLLLKLKEFLKPYGHVFLAFPPWYNPYGGHQQMSRTLLGKMPWFHLLPKKIAGGYLKLLGETPQRITGFLEIVDTRLTTSRFEKLCRSEDYAIVSREFYLINPIYKYKFGLNPLKQLPVLRHIPVLRDFVSTSVYYLIRPSKPNS